MPDIQVFGRDDSPATRAAQRFFRERRIVVHYVDLRKRPIAPAELRRFVERLGRAGPARRDARRRIRDAGLGYLSMDDAEIVERLLADTRLLRLPLVRHGNEVTAGTAEATWAAWLSPVGRRDRHALIASADADDDAATSAGDRPAQVADHEARAAEQPEPWPIQTSPTSASSAAAIIRPRIDTSA